MPRTLSTTARQAIFAAQTGEAFIVLLTLTHPFIPDAIRICSDGQELVSRGQTFLAYPFDFTLVPEVDDGPVQVVLRIDNVDRRIVESVRAVSGEPVRVAMEVVLASSPNILEAGPFDLSLRDTTYDAMVVEGVLRYEDQLNEPYPADEFTPSRFPGLFSRPF